MTAREEAFASVLKAFDDAGISYGIFSGVDPGPAHFLGRDIDLVVQHDQRGSALDLCWKWLETRGWTVAKPGNPWPGCWSIFGFRQAESLEIDLITDLNWGPVFLVEGPSRRLKKIHGYVFDPRGAVCKRLLMPILGGSAPKVAKLAGFEEECLGETCDQVFGSQLGRMVANSILCSDSAWIKNNLKRIRGAAIRSALIKNPLACVRASGRVIYKRIQSHIFRSAPIIDIGSYSPHRDKLMLEVFDGKSIAGFPSVHVRRCQPLGPGVSNWYLLLLSAWWEQIMTLRLLSNSMVVVMNQGIISERLGFNKGIFSQNVRMVQRLPRADLSLWRLDAAAAENLPPEQVQRGWIEGLVEENGSATVEEQIRSWIHHAFLLRHSSRIGHRRSRLAKQRSAASLLLNVSELRPEQVFKSYFESIAKRCTAQVGTGLAGIEFKEIFREEFRKKLSVLDPTLRPPSTVVFETLNPAHGRPAWIQIEAAGACRRWIKAAWDERTKNMLEAEITMVQNIFRYNFKKLRGPEFLRKQSNGSSTWSLWKVRGVETGPESGIPKHLALALAELALSEPIVCQSFVRGSFWCSELLRFPDKINSSFPHAAIIFERLLKRIASDLKDVSVPLGRSHGDLTARGLLFDGTTVCLLNWECSGVDWPLGLDFFDWVVRREMNIARNPPHISCPVIIRKLEKEPEFYIYADFLKIPKIHSISLLRLAVLRRLYLAYTQGFETYAELDYWLKLAFFVSESEGPIHPRNMK